jgi:hypothetical protein
VIQVPKRNAAVAKSHRVSGPSRGGKIISSQYIHDLFRVIKRSYDHTFRKAQSHPLAGFRCLHPERGSLLLRRPGRRVSSRGSERGRAAQASFDVLTVDGALENLATVAIALDAKTKAGKPADAIAALGCVIRGGTGHYDIVAGESARALMDLSVACRIPLANGIAIVENDK